MPSEWSIPKRSTSSRGGGGGANGPLILRTPTPRPLTDRYHGKKMKERA